MRTIRSTRLQSVALLALVFCTTTLHAQTYHVATQALPGGNGSRDTPWATFMEAFSQDILAPGDTLLVHAGTYRESVRPRISLSIIAETPGTAIVSGADILSPDWFDERDSLWILTGIQAKADTSSDVRPRREQLFVNGIRYDHIAGTAKRPGSFQLIRNSGDTELMVVPHTDHAGRLPDMLIEWSVREVLFEPVPDPNSSHSVCRSPDVPGHFLVRGLVFEKAANRLQNGAVCAGSRNSTFENITVRQTASVGMYVQGTGHRVSESVFDGNGQAGLNGRCTDCVLAGNRTSFNNWKGINPLWEAGGGKWTETCRTLFKDHISTDNDGPGLWLDETNSGNVIEGGRFERNLLAGIMLELRTTHTTVRNAYVSTTRRYEWSGAGILVQAAADNTIMDNVIENNDGAGIWLRGDDRAPDGGSLITGNILRNNVQQRGNDFSEISIVAQLAADFTSVVMRGNDIQNSSAPHYFFRIRDVDFRYSGSDESVFETYKRRLKQ